MFIAQKWLLQPKQRPRRFYKTLPVEFFLTPLMLNQACPPKEKMLHTIKYEDCTLHQRTAIISTA